jgi:ribonuclease HI
MELQKETQGRQARGGYSLIPEEKNPQATIGIWGRKPTTKHEAYALLKGVQLAQTKGIRELVVLGDSNTIIRLMVKGTNPRDPSLKKILDRTRLASRDIRTTFYHILWGNNSEADKMANAAIGANPGTLSIDRVSTPAPLY